MHLYWFIQNIDELVITPVEKVTTFGGFFHYDSVVVNAITRPEVAKCNCSCKCDLCCGSKT
jgi:hypothetical protein